MTTKPRYKAKSDRLTYSGASEAEIRCDYALAPFDRASRAADHLWGIDRLPSLVSPATAEKFGRAIAALNAAIEANDPAVTAANAANCAKAITVMEAEARAAGHEPLPPEIWDADIDGFRFCLIRETNDWPQAGKARPGVQVYTLREVAVALQHYRDNKFVSAVKDAFPGAEVTAVRTPTPMEEYLGDEIPF